MNGLLNRSLTDKNPIEIIYLNSQQEITQRVIRILRVSDNHVKAYCYAKRQLRTFKKDCILSAGSIKRVGA